MILLFFLSRIVSKYKKCFIYYGTNKLIHIFSSMHDYLLSEEVLASASLHIGAKDIILTEVNISDEFRFSRNVKYLSRVVYKLPQNDVSF